MQRWGGQITRRIQRRLIYPRKARNQPGVAVVALTLSAGGQLIGASLARSSGNPILDQAAIATVQRVGRYPAAPDGLTKPRYAFQIPVRFQAR